jgi:hypothetical protein
LLRIDWLSHLIGALVRWLEAAERFGVLPCRVFAQAGHSIDHSPVPMTTWPTWWLAWRIAQSIGTPRACRSCGFSRRRTGLTKGKIASAVSAVQCNRADQRA